MMCPHHTLLYLQNEPYVFPFARSYFFSSSNPKSKLTWTWLLAILDGGAP
jgi:hypothetical protein